MEKRPPRADRKTLEYYERGKERDRLDDPRGIRRERALVVVLAFVVLAPSALALWLYLSGKPPADDSLARRCCSLLLLVALGGWSPWEAPPYFEASSCRMGE